MDLTLEKQGIPSCCFSNPSVYYQHRVQLSDSWKEGCPGCLLCFLLKLWSEGLEKSSVKWGAGPRSQCSARQSDLTFLGLLLCKVRCHDAILPESLSQTG